jgi:methylenetetrahydrofolate reductase (NADPH)
MVVFVLALPLIRLNMSKLSVMPQYLKLHKKIKAGADFIITQLGYDIEALKQAKSFLTKHDYSQQILACVMPLTLGRANFMVKHKVAGIVITRTC